MSDMSYAIAEFKVRGFSQYAFFELNCCCGKKWKKWGRSNSVGWMDVASMRNGRYPSRLSTTLILPVVGFWSLSKGIWVYNIILFGNRFFVLGYYIVQWYLTCCTGYYMVEDIVYISTLASLKHQQSKEHESRVSYDLGLMPPVTPYTTVCRNTSSSQTPPSD